MPRRFCDRACIAENGGDGAVARTTRFEQRASIVKRDSSVVLEDARIVDKLERACVGQ
jgi:hypothetical protein